MTENWKYVAQSGCGFGIRTMPTVNDCKRLLDEGWVIKLWFSDDGIHYSGQKYCASATRFPGDSVVMACENPTPEQALCRLAEKMGGNSVEEKPMDDLTDNMWIATGKTAVVIVLVALLTLAIVNTVHVINCPAASTPELTQEAPDERD